MEKKSIVTEYYNAKFDELHFIDQVIRNLHHLEYTYKHGALKDEREAFGIKDSLVSWNYKREKVLKEIVQIERDYDEPPLYKVEK
jgi:hypothetical protein